jgi:hypothetical protein
MVRWVLEHLWTPVGAGVKSDEEVDALALYLFSDDEGREQLREIDQTIAELPGLEGLTLMEAALDTALERARQKPGWAGSPVAPEKGPSSTAAEPVAERHWVAAKA